MLNRNLKFYVSVSAFATAIAAVPNGAQAQVAVAGQIPIADTQCSGGTFFHPLSQCEVSGTRTSTTPVRTATPNATTPGTSIFTHSEDVTFDGTLVVGGAALGTSPSSSFIIPPQFVYSPDAVSVDAALSYTGQVSAVLPTSVANTLASQPGTALGQFQKYDIKDLELRAINVDYRGEGVETKGGGGYSINLKSADPAAITNNSTALAGSFRGTNETGGLVFGKLGGTASVIVAEPNSAVFTPSPIALNEDGSPSSVFLSPMAVRMEVTSEETTRLDENGLVTPTVAVTDGINMNGSRITNLGDAVNGTDAVNLGQVVDLIASNSPIQNAEGDGALVGGNGSSANGLGAVALGQGQQANGNGAVAIGDPNVATGNGALAIGAENTAIGTGAVALGERNTATGQGAIAIGTRNDATAKGSIAIGGNSTASEFGNVALGFDAEATAIGTTALGSKTVATANRATAVGRAAVATGVSSTALGYGAEATGSNGTATGHEAIATGVNSSAFGSRAVASADSSVALGQGSVADQANTVSVGAAGAERRVVNVAAAVNATDAVNKSQLDAESAARQAADMTLQANITAEAATRLAADTTLQNAINSEASTRAAADTTLQNAIDSEATTRAAADTTLQNGINAEAATRATAVAALQTGLSNEASARAAGDIAEANARAAAENRLQTQINTLGTSLSSLTGRVTSLENNVRQDRKDARQGIAAAVAMTPAPMPSAPGKVAYTVNVANFRDEQAVAASLAMRLRGPNAMAITAGVAYGGGANTAVRVGVAGEF